LESNYTTSELSNFVVVEDSMPIAFILKSDGYFYTGNLYFTIKFAGESPYYYDMIYFSTSGTFEKLQEQNSNYSLVNLIRNLSSSSYDSSKIYISSVPIYSDENKTSVLFSPNYFPMGIEPEPSPSPEPTDTPEVDVSELEKCDSFVCDISDTILDDFDDDKFPFVKTIIKFLLLLLLIFIIISPFWLIYKLARWLM